MIPFMSVPVLDRFSLAGKVALVTGASSDLSAGFAVALAHPKSPVPRWPSSATCPALSGEKSP